MIVNFRVNVVKNGFHVSVENDEAVNGLSYPRFDEYVYDTQRSLFSALRDFLQTPQAETK